MAHEYDEDIEEIEDEIEDFSIEELQELDDLNRLELSRKDRVTKFINDMERPERVLQLSSDDETTDENPINNDGATIEDDKAATDGDGKDVKTPSDTEGGSDADSKSTSKIQFGIFDFFELEKVPDWYNAFLIIGSEFSHDKTCKIETLQAERKEIFSIVSTAQNLTDEQRTYYQARYQILETAINERVEGRKTISERLEFPKQMKEKFGEAFKAWVESLKLNYELSPGLLLLFMFLASLLYAAGVVYMSQKKYQSV